MEVIIKMAIFIINRSKPNLDPYHIWLEENTDDKYMFTKTEYVNEHKSKNIYKGVYGFDNFSKNELPYHIIENNINISEFNKNYIVSTHEYDLLRTGYARERYNLKGQNSESARAFRNKILMKDLIKGKVKVPKYREVKSVYDILNFIQENGYPVIVKPTEMAASIGVNLIKNETQLTSYLEKGISGNIEIEEYIEGHEYHIDGLFKENNMVLSRVSQYINDGLSYQENKFLGSINLEETNPVAVKLKQETKKVLELLPTPQNIIAFHAEFFVTSSGEAVFCEIASRAGGSKIVEVMEYATGINIVKEWVLSQCNSKTSIVYEDMGRLAGWVIIPPKNGKLEAMETKIPFEEWIIEIEMQDNIIGKVFQGADSSIDRIAEIAVKGKSEKELKERIYTIVKWFDENTKWGN